MDRCFNQSPFYNDEDGDHVYVFDNQIWYAVIIRHKAYSFESLSSSLSIISHETDENMYT